MVMKAPKTIHHRDTKYTETQKGMKIALTALLDLFVGPDRRSHVLYGHRQLTIRALRQCQEGRVLP